MSVRVEVIPAVILFSPEAQEEGRSLQYPELGVVFMNWLEPGLAGLGEYTNVNVLSAAPTCCDTRIARHAKTFDVKPIKNFIRPTLLFFPQKAMGGSDRVHCTA
ncbi:hypothetical protein D3C77_435990 [compost metagenome]